MLKYIFDSLQLTEFQVTPKAIKRLRIAAILAIPAIPSFAAVKLFSLPTGMNTFLLIIGWVSLLALVYVAFSRIANRFYSPNRYLDEWEINKKEAANSFAFLCVLLGLAVFVAVFGLIMLMSGREIVTLHYAEILWFAFYVGAFGMLAQFLHLIFSLEGLGGVKGPKTADVKAQDWRWRGVAAAMLIGSLIISILVASIIPFGVSKASDKAIAQCGQGNVKSVSTKGVFKSEIHCFDESIRKP